MRLVIAAGTPVNAAGALPRDPVPGVSAAAASPVFQRAVAAVLVSEGGYGNDPNDRGGVTKFGISQRAYPGESVANLTEDRARALYWRDYWLAARCDVLPPALAVMVFDAAVQHGVVSAVRLLQHVLNTEIDGQLGPITRAAAETAAAHDGAMSNVLDMAVLRVLRYASLPTFARFGRGWVARLFRVYRACLVEAFPNAGGGQ